MKKFKLDFSHTKSQFPQIPLAFDQLEDFSTNHRLNAEFYNFIANHRDIKKLKILTSNSSAENVKVKQFNFLETMHSLREINLCKYTFRIPQVIRIFDGVKTLKKFGFSMHVQDTFSDLVERSREGWSVKKGQCIFHQFYAELKRNI